MPRIRTIKPEFWTDAKILRLSRDARLFFVGLWSFADDNGVIEADLLQLKVRIFPADQDIDEEAVQELLSELESLALIRRYEYDGKRYIWIVNFSKHQKIDRPRKSNFPLPQEIINNPQDALKNFYENQATFPEVHQTSEGTPTNRGNPPPYEEIVRLYHEKLPELPRCRVLNEKRKAFIRARWREILSKPELLAIFVPDDELQMYSERQKGLLWFKRFFCYVAESEFLTGKVLPSKGCNKPFVADLEWLIKPSNFTKVLEGRYHDNHTNANQTILSKSGIGTARAALELLAEIQQETEDEVVH